MDIKDMEKKPIAEKVAQLRLAPDAADAPHAPRGLPSSDDDLARLILDIVADAEVETGAPVSLIAVRSSLVMPPLGEEKRRRIDAALRRLVPRLLEEDGNMSNPSFGLTLDGWLRSHRAAAVEKAIDDFLRLYHKKVAGPDPEFRSTSWDEVRAEAGVQDDLFHLYVIISGKAGLWSGGSHTSGRIQPGTKPTAQFNRPTDIANLVELTDAAQLLAYRQRRMAELEIGNG